MILRRLGNKKAMQSKITPYFPLHKIYYEPFFGSGSIYFSKPQAKYNILNDYDQEVFNLFMVAKNKRSELAAMLYVTPLSEKLFYYWKENEETEPIKKALRFLYLSNFSYLGKADTFRLLHSDVNYKVKLEKLLNTCSSRMANVLFRGVDFRDFFKGIIDSDSHIGKKDRFIYADGPYLETENNYNTPSWTENDSLDLFNVLEESNIKFAMSEFKHPFIIDQAKKRKLKVIDLGERKNIGNRKDEILIVNYAAEYDFSKDKLNFKS